MIQSAAEYAHQFDAEPSRERTRYFWRAKADAATWLEIIDTFPRCRLQVASTRELPLSVLERLMDVPDFGIQKEIRENDAWRKSHPLDQNRSDPGPNDLAEYDLTEGERRLLRDGTFHWFGPAHASEELAKAMGFGSLENLKRDIGILSDAIMSRKALSHRDWTRALLSTEILFSSLVMGAAWDWEIISSLGVSDAENLKILRLLQQRLIHSTFAVRSFGTFDDWTDQFPTKPRGYAGIAVRNFKENNVVGDPRIWDLNYWVETVHDIRSDSSSVSSVRFFDPLDGGVSARIMILVDVPEKVLDSEHASDFESLDNDDDYAATLFNLIAESGLPRESFVLVNATGWKLTESDPLQANSRYEWLQASLYVDSLVNTFDELKLVIAMGERAGEEWTKLRESSRTANAIAYVEAPNPSPTHGSLSADDHKIVVDILKMAAHEDAVRENHDFPQEIPTEHHWDSDRIAIKLTRDEIVALNNCISIALSELSGRETNQADAQDLPRLRFLHRQMKSIARDTNY